MDTAATLFRDRGFVGTSIRGIATEMGWTSASIYHHVSSKADLLYEISKSALQELHDPVQSVLDGSGTAVERLRAMILVHSTIVFSRTDYHAAMILELRHLRGAQHDEVQGLRDRYERLLEQALQEARDDGALVTAPSLKFQRLTLLNLLNWPLIWYRAGGEFSPVQMGTGLAETFLRGTLRSPH